MAVSAEKTISKTALAWALTHVAHPGDCIKLLAVIPGTKPRKRSFWGFHKLAVDCQTVDLEKQLVRASQISESCSQMVLQLHYQIQVKVQIKVVSGTPTGVVAAEAKNNAVSWVILDKNLQQEQKHCLEELQCNIVVMKSSKPMVLRLNLSSDEPQTPFYSAAGSPTSYIEDIHGQNLKHSTPVTSPEEPSTSYTQTTQESSKSSPDSVTSPYIAYEKNPLSKGLNKGNYNPSSDQNKNNNLRTRPKSSATSDHKTVFYIAQNHSTIEKSPTGANYQNTNKINSSIIRYNQDTVRGLGLNQICESGYLHGSSIRQAMSLGKNSSIPPPLCSLCKHKAPAFGKPLKQFDYEELIEVTDGFSNINFLAEGRFGKVYRGVLRDGQVVAVKKLKFVGSQGDADFCREVCVLSCAQHRNVVLLIGFCVEGKTRLLVYEYICDGSLDFHLHGNKRTPLDWQCRQKIAIGAARGLRYLHEDCRVGCIIHRDMRPSNVLLTHDHEPLVADIGLARLHNDSVICEERVFGTIGYLAPEYFNCGEITEKADIYAFGLILLELITGRKIIDLQLEPAEVLVNIYQLLDPCLSHYQFPELPLEVQAMSHVAFLCLQQDPESRPPMSKVLRILEGADVGIALRLDLNATGSRSGHMKGLRTKAPLEQRRHSRNFSH